MLITNFSAGELSKNLFGRTDIPQYYSGVSRLENFDVIPTGGLKRRGGFERVLPLEQGDGRFIPFIINRHYSYLLYLTPGDIKVFKLEKEQPLLDVSADVAGLKLYESFNEIKDVQYAQNFDTMVLVHENRSPIEITFINNTISIQQLKIKFDVSVEAGERITDTDVYSYKNDDEIYSGGWLAKEDHYPSAVCFFNGRLVFASTRNKQQRLFFSAIKKADEDYNFATYKIFLTEKREYITIFGTVDSDNPNKDTIILGSDEGIKFHRALENYYFETPFFSPETRIEKLQGNILKTTKGANITLPITQDVRDDLNNIERISEELDKLNSTEYSIASQNYSFTDLQGKVVVVWINLHITIGATKIKLRASGSVSIDNWTNYHDLPKDAVYKYENNPQYYNDFIKSKLTGYVINNNNLNIVSEQLKNNSTKTMKYNLVSGDVNETYYNYGSIIKDIVIRRYENAKNIYMPLYTREIIADRTPTPDCGFTFELASDTNEAIQWLAVNKGLIVGTETGEWIIPPGVHALNVQAVLNSRFGSDRMQGTAIGDATCFFQTGKKSLVEYYIPQQDNNFRANNMAMLSDDMLRGDEAVDFDYTTSPYTKLIITRKKGEAVTLLYERGTGTFAWSRLITEGKIKSAAVIPNYNGYDDIYMLVERNGAFYLEVLRETSGVYLDSYKQWEGGSGGYSNDAVIYDEKEKKVYPINPPPEIKENRYIGYKYTSRVISMPILADNSMKPNNVKNILIRFTDSYLPKLTAHPNGAGNVITGKEPFTGVLKTMFPGVWDHDVMFELYLDKPERCKILAINTEVN